MARITLPAVPDMALVRQEAVFVPFFGVPTATLTSLARFARMGRAKVVPVLTCITEQGYDVEVGPAWDNYPSTDMQADVQRMNQELAKRVLTMPEQYYWVHKRFKTRPPGEPSVYLRQGR